MRQNPFTPQHSAAEPIGFRDARAMSWASFIERDAGRIAAARPTYVTDADALRRHPELRFATTE